MKSSSSLASFFGWAAVWFCVTTVAWMQVSAWTSYPAAGIAHIVLGAGTNNWVRSIHKEPGLLQVNTRIRISMPEKDQESGTAELVAEAKPANYAYGLPLFIALLLASGSKRFFWRVLVGYAVLLIPQTFSLVFDILKQIIVVADSPAALGVAWWQMEGIALGYQFGSLLLPALAPVALWLWLDREFFAAVIIDGWLRKAAAECE